MVDSKLTESVRNAAATAREKPGINLLAKLNAYSVFESRGVTQSERPRFADDLPDQAYLEAHQYLGIGLRFLHQGSPTEDSDYILERAGELLEKLCESRWGDTDFQRREMHNAALAYYLSGHYPRAYVLMKGLSPKVPLDGPHDLLRSMFLKDLAGMRRHIESRLLNPAFSDTELRTGLEFSEISPESAIEHILHTTLARAFSFALEFARTGHEGLFTGAQSLLDTGIRLCIDQELSDWWWLFRCTKAMLDEFERNSLWTNLRAMLSEDQHGFVQGYIRTCFSRRIPVIELWRSQTQAIPRIDSYEDEVPKRPSFCIKMPTSSGKTRVAEIAMLRFMLDFAEEPSKKCLYVAPSRALATEIEQGLAEAFGPIGLPVSTFYGGFDFNPVEAEQFDRTRVLVVTPEKADAFFRHYPDLASQVGLIVLDEGHMISQGQRGLKYEFFLQRMIKRFTERGVRTLFISAVVPNVSEFTRWITGKDTADGLISSEWRASRQMLGLLTWDGNSGKVEYLYRGIEPLGSEMFIPRFVKRLPSSELRYAKASRLTFPGKNKKHEEIALAAIECVQDGTTLVFASQPSYVNAIGEAVLTALSLQDALAKRRGASDEGLPMSSEPGIARLRNECLQLAIETTGSSSLAARALKAGFVIHHGDIPKSLRVRLEELVRIKGVSLIIATSTLAQGVNLPIKTVLVHSLHLGPGKYIPPTDFWNICGRAGRAMEENEGSILILTDATGRSPVPEMTSRDFAVGRLRRYVRQAQSASIASAIRLFLKKVLVEWREAYPEANLSELYQHLADDTNDWLSEDSRRWLDTMDSQLLAILEELDVSDCSPAAVETIFSTSLFMLQVVAHQASDLLDAEQAIAMVASRLQYVSRSVGTANRQRYYRMGLSLTSCNYIQAHQAEIRTTLGQAQYFMQWFPEVRSAYLTDVSRMHVMALSDVRPEKTIDLPEYWPVVVFRWLLGDTPEQIVQHPLISEHTNDPMRISGLVDDLCDYRLPWGINALVGYWYPNTGNADVISQDWVLPEACAYFPSMLRYGVCSPAATILMAMGLASRRVAIEVGERFVGMLNTEAISRWLQSLSHSEIDTWDIDPLLRNEVIEFVRIAQNSTREQDDPAIDIVTRISTTGFVCSLEEGISLLVRPLTSDEVELLTPAGEPVDTVRVHERAHWTETGSQIQATVVSVTPSNKDGKLEVKVKLTHQRQQIGL